MKTIAHLSDLHFGQKNQVAAFESLRTYLREIKPDLTLVTGDIVDTPDEEGYRKARKDLAGIEAGPLYVCAGNHDRHPLGNALGQLIGKVAKRLRRSSKASAWFDNFFVGIIATPHEPRDLDLGNWKLRILGIDTSINAKYSAQGIVAPHDLESLRQSASTAHDRDLVIVMQHHHLIPVQDLENQQQNSAGLFAPTVLLNSVTVLEALTQANVNLALHGHEHHRTVARYGTLTARRGELVIVGAGSSTGMKTNHGCELGRASFNLIELRDDRSIWVREVRYHGSSWSPTPEPAMQLLDSPEIRRSRFYRRTGVAAANVSRISKCMEFHKNRDISITETWSGCTLVDDLYRKETVNSTGHVSDATVTFRWKDKPPRTIQTGFERNPNNDHSYKLDVPLEQNDPRELVSVTTNFKWNGGCLLTTQDMKWAPDNPGRYRANGYEFAAVDAVTDLESLSLLVRIPEEMAPRPEDVELFVHEPNQNDLRHGPEELKHLVRFHAPGLFSLDVPYPIKDVEYALAWKPTAAEPPASAQAERFRKLAREKGQALLSAFAGAFKKGDFAVRVSIALYVPALDDLSKLVGVAMELPPNCEPAEHPAAELALKNTPGLHRTAWHDGYRLLIPGPADEGRRSQEMGLLDRERAMAVTPVTGLATEDVPWALLRLAIIKENQIVNGEQGPTEEQILSLMTDSRFGDGILAMLQEFTKLDRL